MQKQLVLDAYADGSPFELIMESFHLTREQLTEILHTYKEENRSKKTFSEEFKRMIAERDTNGVKRGDIARELNIHANTVKKSCDEFGQALKGQAEADQAYEVVANADCEDKFTCPTCSSKRVNEVDENVVYCMSCGNEHIFKKDHVLRIAWEYLD